MKKRDAEMIQTAEDIQNLYKSIISDHRRPSQASLVSI